MDLLTLVDVRPDVRGGNPCFVGTRITVYDVLEYPASGMTSDEIVADFPELTVDHVRAALAFAAVREHRLAAPAREPAVRSEPLADVEGHTAEEN